MVSKQKGKMAEARAAAQDRLHRVQLAQLHHAERRVPGPGRRAARLPAARRARAQRALGLPALVRPVVAPPAVARLGGVPRLHPRARLLVHDGAERARRADVRAAALRVRRGLAGAGVRAGGGRGVAGAGRGALLPARGGAALHRRLRARAAARPRRRQDGTRARAALHHAAPFFELKYSFSKLSYTGQES